MVVICMVCSRFYIIAKFEEIYVKYDGKSRKYG